MLFAGSPAPRAHTRRSSPALEQEQLLWQCVKTLWLHFRSEHTLQWAAQGAYSLVAKLLSKLCCNKQDTNRSYFGFPAENPPFAQWITEQRNSKTKLRKSKQYLSDCLQVKPPVMRFFALQSCCDSLSWHHTREEVLSTNEPSFKDPVGWGSVVA